MTTLPLYDDGSSSCDGRNDDSKRLLVGWSPVSSACNRVCSAKYVKVKKEDGRKVDLSLHASYDELLATLTLVFPTTTDDQHNEEINNSTSIIGTHVDMVVTYEDGEGDWQEEEEEYDMSQ